MKRTIAVHVLLISLVATPIFAQAPSAEDTPDVLTLEAAQAKADVANEDLAIAKIQVVRSISLRREALAGLMPNMTAALSGSLNGPEVTLGDRTITQEWNWGGNLRASIVLFDGSLYPLYSAAKRGVEASEAEVVWVDQTVTYQVEQSFYLLAAAQEELDVARKIIDLRKAYLERAEALAEQGVALPLDAARARNQFLSAKQNIIEAEANVGNLSDALAVLLGEATDGGLRVTTSGEPQAPPTASQMATRQDLRANELQIAALIARENSVFWSLFPAVGISGVGRVGPESLSNPDGFAWTISLDLTWLMYDGGARYARMDALEAEADQSRLRLQRAEREAAAGATRALRNWGAAFEAISVAEENRNVATEAYDMAFARFEAGLATSVEVTEASDELVRAELAVVAARMNSRLAESLYRYTTGATQ